MWTVQRNKKMCPSYVTQILYSLLRTFCSRTVQSGELQLLWETKRLHLHHTICRQYVPPLNVGTHLPDRTVWRHIAIWIFTDVNTCRLRTKTSRTASSFVGRDSSVGIATRYAMDGPGIESRWRRHFPHPSKSAQGPTQPPEQWVPGLSRG